MTDLKIYQDFADYVVENTGLFERDHSNAVELRKEIKSCIKKKKPLGSYWRLVAYGLFERHKIKDERITKDDILRELSFEYDGEKHTVEVRYVDFDVAKFPEESILTQNVMREDEEEYIIKTLKRSIERYKNCDTRKVYMYQNYVLIFADNNDKKEMSQ